MLLSIRAGGGSIFIAALLLVALGLPGAAATRSVLEESGDLQALVIAYKETLPGIDTNAYVEPSDEEAGQVVEAVRLAVGGLLPEASALLAPLGYELVLFQDVPTGNSHLLLRERAPCGRCWGLYVLNLSGTARDVTVEAPHPLFDLFTPELAIEAYVRLEAQEFLMAGTHRFANGQGSLVSDMARNPRSLFQRLHQELTDSGTQVLQYHGFALRNHPGYPDVVLSNGGPQPHVELFLLRDALEARGETVGIYDGENWRDLGATVNPQGQHTRSIGGRFYHLEHEFAIRNDPARRSAMVDAALEALRTPPSTHVDTPVSSHIIGRMPPLPLRVNGAVWSHS